MTFKEFNNYLYSSDFPHKYESLIVFAAFNEEDNYTFFTEVLIAYPDPDKMTPPEWYWESDREEFQNNIEILGYVPISQVHRFIPLNCEHKLHMVGEDHLINEFLEKTNKDKMNKELAELTFNTQPYIYGYMYGNKRIDNRIIKIEKEKLNSFKDENLGYWFRWGWPGPDINDYLFKDYGVTWSFNLEDLEGEYIDN